MQYIYAYDLTSLRELWNHLDQRMFSKLEHNFMPGNVFCEWRILIIFILYFGNRSSLLI